MERERLLSAFQLQVGGRRAFESPFYEGLLTRALNDWEGPHGRRAEWFSSA